MFSVFKKNRLEATKAQEEGLRKLHYGQTSTNQRTVDILKEGREVRDTKAPLAHSRFSDWVTSRVATGEIEAPVRKLTTVHDHQFRDRVKLAEIGERSFGVYYEKEKERVERNVDTYKSLHLQREAWFKNQNAPIQGKVNDLRVAIVPMKKQTGTALRTREFTDAERINAAVEDLGSTNFDMHAGYGWKGYKKPEFRPKPPKTFEGADVQSLTHARKEFVWSEPVMPISVVEPYRDTIKEQQKRNDASGSQKTAEQRKAESKTRFDFDSKMDGKSRLNFQIPTPKPKPEPVARIKRYNNSLKGITCFLPHSMTAGFDGDGEVKRQAQSIVVGI